MEEVEKKYGVEYKFNYEFESPTNKSNDGFDVLVINVNKLSKQTVEKEIENLYGRDGNLKRNYIRITRITPL